VGEGVNSGTGRLRACKNLVGRLRSRSLEPRSARLSVLVQAYRRSYLFVGLLLAVGGTIQADPPASRVIAMTRAIVTFD
jgi:hypothetical protein